MMLLIGTESDTDHFFRKYIFSFNKILLYYDIYN